MHKITQGEISHEIRSYCTSCFILATAVPLAAGHAEGIQIQVPGVVVAPGPEHRDRDRCEALDSREHELRARLEHAAYGQERERTEHELREAREQAEHCHR
jgi:hypothetical protein